MIALKIALTILVVWFCLFVVSQKNADMLRRVKPETARMLENISAALVVILIVTALVLIWASI